MPISEAIHKLGALPIIDNETVDACASADAVVVLGGDGTMLKAARRCALADIPLMGINFGHMGFLTEAPISDAQKAMAALISGEYEISRRLMLAAECEGRTNALNDICVNRTSGATVSLRVHIDGEAVDSYKCDGIICATPSGSTAYNLSAGGPIIDPSADVLVITPVAAHSLTARPIIIAADRTVEIETILGEAAVFADGAVFCGLPVSCRVRLTRSKYTVSLIKIGSGQIFERLKQKMLR